MGKGADMSWEDIQNEFDIMNQMSCRPVGLQKVPGNHIFDEDQSVKWNREQVELNNKKYQSEVARLNTEKNKARDFVYNLIIEKIQYEVGHRLSRKKAEAIWNRAYEDGHSFGFYEIRCRLSDLIDLAIAIMGNDEMHVEGAAKATNKTVVSSRFDSSGFKKEYPDLFTEYSRETSYKRFCVL